MSIHQPPAPVAYISSILDCDPGSGTLTWKARANQSDKWNELFEGKVAGRPGSDGYLRLSISKRGYLAHRVVWAITYGSWPDGKLDHIDGDRQNNSVSNLRLVSNQESQRNLGVYSTNKSGVSGVYWCPVRSKWVARAKDRNRRLCLGYFDTVEDAARARAKALSELGYHQNHGARPSWGSE